ncbi:MAG: CPBP family intramembrane metalloprotease [Balneolaceae bacterium]|nr:MAG: CPBP family intramembrane metalloprotease [Balneolaceae bacterium]
MIEKERFPVSEYSWIERNGFAPWAAALLWLVVVFVLFQLLSALFIVIFLALKEGSADLLSIMQQLGSELNLLFIVNSAGQILMMGLATFLIVRLHAATGTQREFLRLGWKPKTAGFIFGGLLLILAVQPLVIWIGYINSLLPVPESITALQESQLEMIRDFLMQDGVLLFALFAVAVVPGVCEEVLFRGYILRAFEKSWGIIVAIVVSGFVFGLFHLQIANLLPLAALGMVLGLMTWLSGSIWPAVAAHFMNNAMAVVAGTFYPELFFRELSPEFLPPLWLVIPATLVAVAIVYVMIQRSENIEPKEHAERS